MLTLKGYVTAEYAYVYIKAWYEKLGALSFTNLVKDGLIKVGRDKNGQMIPTTTSDKMDLPLYRD